MNEKYPFKIEEYLQEDDETAVSHDLLLPLLKQLQNEELPIPTSVQTNQLINTLLPELPPPSAWQQWQTAITNNWLWLLLQSQLRIVRQTIWAASAFVITIGVIVSVLWQNSAMGDGFPFILLAPVVAAIGIATLYNDNDHVWELEMTTAVSPRLLLLTRLLLVFGFDLILALSGSLILAFILPYVTLSALITTWLAPMTFLTAVAFLITILTGATEIGILVSMTLWGVQILRLIGGSTLLTQYWPNLLHSDSHSLLWTATLLLTAVALWLGGREERWIIQ